MFSPDTNSLTPIKECPVPVAANVAIDAKSFILLDLPLSSRNVVEPLEDGMILMEGMTGNLLLWHIADQPTKSILATSMNSATLTANRKRIKQKLLISTGLERQMSEAFASNYDLTIPLKSEMAQKLEKAKIAVAEYQESKENVAVMESVLASEEEEVLAIRAEVAVLTVWNDCLSEFGDTPMIQRPFGAHQNFPIKVIRSKVVLETPESCFALGRIGCHAVLYILHNFGFMTHLAFRGNWEIPPNGDLEGWRDTHGEFAVLSTRRQSIALMQRRIHDYLGFVNTSELTDNVVLNVADTSQEIVELFHAEHMRREALSREDDSSTELDSNESGGCE
jgi:hypothetical protein